MYRNILVPIDGSQTARCGLDEAIRLAQALRSRISLLHVVSSTPWLSASGMPVAKDVVELLRSQGETLLSEGVAAVHAAGLEVTPKLTDSFGQDAGPVIVAQARTCGADLIVCGTHGRRGLRRAVMGSDAEHVVRHAPVPVLLVRVEAILAGEIATDEGAHRDAAAA
jgi:nucleotide-binding universal stress UspA family protein